MFQVLQDVAMIWAGRQRSAKKISAVYNASLESSIADRTPKDIRASSSHKLDFEKEDYCIRAPVLKKAVCIHRDSMIKQKVTSLHTLDI